MATTISTAVARHIAGPHAFIFNDRLADGRRSLKVWGWSKEKYTPIKTALEHLGCQVNLVEFDSCDMYSAKRRVARLHVTEPNK
jgi:hypothetical protein